MNIPIGMLAGGPRKNVPSSMLPSKVGLGMLGPVPSARPTSALASISPEQDATNREMGFDPDTDTPQDPKPILGMLKPVGHYQGWGGLQSIGEGIHNAAVHARHGEAVAEQRASGRAASEAMKGWMAGPGMTGDVSALLAHPSLRQTGMQIYMDQQRDKRALASEERRDSRQDARDGRHLDNQRILAGEQREHAERMARDAYDRQQQDPYRKAQEELLRAQTEAARQKPTGKTIEVNGKVVHVPPDGSGAQVIYDGGTNFDKLPEFAAKSAGFTSRMVEAEGNLRRIMGDTSRFDPTSGATGLVRMLPEGLGNFFVRGEDMQQYEQAGEQWIRAFLRKESGAAIGKDEFKRDFKVYFPQPGDSPAVVRQKERARLDAKRSFLGETRGFFEHTSPQHAAQLKQWVEQADTSREPVETRTVNGRNYIKQDGKWVNIDSGSTRRAEQNQAMRGTATPTGSAIDFLRSNATPDMRRAFDEKYGAGAAARILGGAP